MANWPIGQLANCQNGLCADWVVIKTDIWIIIQMDEWMNIHL